MTHKSNENLSDSFNGTERPYSPKQTNNYIENKLKLLVKKEEKKSLLFFNYILL